VEYLKSRRGRILLACFAASSALLVIFPRIDLRVSGLFYDRGFPWQFLWWNRLLHAGLFHFLAVAVLALVGLYLYNRFTKRNVAGVDGRSVIAVLLVLVVGAGLIVNFTFKDHFGRARPRDVVEFGGTREFTPAFVISDQCNRNCSFSSGEGSGGFFFLAIARALNRRRGATVVAALFGSLVAFSRIAAGAHFFSDTVVSFFVMLIVTDVAFFYLKPAAPISTPAA